MRLCRFLPSAPATAAAAEQPRLGAVRAGAVVDLAAAGIDESLLDLLALASALNATADTVTGTGADARTRWAEIEAAVAAADTIEPGRLVAPIEPPNYLAIGLNYRAHVAEGGRADPERPVVFNKQISSITGPGDPIHVPTAAPDLVDYEGELAVVIGRRCRRVPRDRAHEVIGGYTIANDVSVRDWQKASPTMTMGKSWDTHGPIGPHIVTPDEVPDPHALQLSTMVDDEVRQAASTSAMIFDIPSLIEHLSTAFTLLPGTVIATGTPEGVGFYREPRAMLQDGQTVRIAIDGLGTLENPVIAEPAGGVEIG